MKKISRKKEQKCENFAKKCVNFRDFFLAKKINVKFRKIICKIRKKMFAKVFVRRTSITEAETPLGRWTGQN